MAFPTDKIYKFHSFNNNSITSLSSSKVWFSNLEQLNDPFEGAIEYIYPKTEDEKISEYVKFFSKNISGKFGNDRAHEIAIEKYMESPDNFLALVDDLLAKTKKCNLKNCLNLMYFLPLLIYQIMNGLTSQIF